MATNKKQAAPAVSEIIREQIQLAKTEKELKTLLEKVNDHINQLLIEELQLQSCLLSRRQAAEPSSSTKMEPISVSEQFDSVSVINEQKLDLFSNQNNQSIEEYDD